MGRIISLIRYRFFLFAGIFPYFLGQVIAFNTNQFLNWQNFWLGFLGISLVLVGVELFNEYFDAKDGGDRIFSQENSNIPNYFFPLAVCSMLFAFSIGLYFAFQLGWPVLLFSFLGSLGAYFYVGPPLRWAYRGLGELVIALCYGPLMVLGSYYIQTQRIDFVPFFASLICALSIFCLSVLNEIPDYYQDRLVGKRNLVVRFGKQRSIRIFSLSLACIFIPLALGMIWKKLPLSALVPFLLLPWSVRSVAKLKKNYDNPKSFIPAINTSIAIYLVIVFSLGIGYLR